MIKLKNFSSSMTEVQQRAWNAFVVVVKRFLGNTKAANYKDLVETLLDSFHALGCSITIKVHFLKSHLNEFDANAGDMSDKHGQRFHQYQGYGGEISRSMEHTYDGRLLLEHSKRLCR